MRLFRDVSFGWLLCRVLLFIFMFLDEELGFHGLLLMTL